MNVGTLLCQKHLIRLKTLGLTLNREVLSALLGRESLGTVAIEDELLDPDQVLLCQDK